jgi:hypothetical protein
MEKTKRKLFPWEKFFPFVFILIASILPFISYFISGLPSGDDMIFHLTEMENLLLSFKSGIFGIGPTHTLSGFFGLNIYLFYGCLPHYLIAFLTWIFEWAGASIISMTKIVVILDVFITSVFFYLLALKITKSTQISTLLGVAFAFFPYRITCFLYRAAYSEAFAIGFMSIVFYGCYRIVHDERPRASSYIAVILGMSGIILSHPFTALVTAIAVAIYFLFNIKPLIRVFKQKTTWFYLPIALLLIVGFVSFYFFPMISALQSGIYRISNAELMLTTKDYIVTTLDGGFRFSGFLSFYWLDTIHSWGWYATADNSLNWGLGIGLTGFSFILTILMDYFVGKCKKVQAFRPLFALVTTFLFSVIYFQRIEVYLALAIFYVAYLFVFYARPVGDEFFREPQTFKSYITNPDIYLSLLIIVPALCLIFYAWPWDYVPSLFYKCQFTFRMWSICGFFLYFLAIIACKWMKGRRTAIISLAGVVAILFAFLQSPVDKRIDIANEGIKYTTTDEALVASLNTIGWQNEYVPNIYYDSSYTSQYSNSLYYKVKNKIQSRTGFPRGKENYYTPAFLEGSGSIVLNDLNTPNASFSITINSETSLVQIPQFYYDGYDANIVDEDDKTTSLNVSNVDELVAISVPKGTYTLNVSFSGSTKYKVGLVALGASIAGIIAYGIVGHYLVKKEKKKEETSATLA